MVLTFFKRRIFIVIEIFHRTPPPPHPEYENDNSSITLVTLGLDSQRGRTKSCLFFFFNSLGTNSQKLKYLSIYSEYMY